MMGPQRHPNSGQVSCTLPAAGKRTVQPRWPVVGEIFWSRSLLSVDGVEPDHGPMATVTVGEVDARRPSSDGFANTARNSVRVVNWTAFVYVPDVDP